MKGQSYFTPSDCVFVRSGDQVMGAGYPINNLFLQHNMAPLAVDNTMLGNSDDALVSQLFTGDLAVPLGLFIEGVHCSTSSSIPNDDGDLKLMPEPLHDKLLSMVETKRPTSIKSTTRRRKMSSKRKTRRSN